MNCRTCTHEMKEIGELLYWCPRCGSLLLQYPKGGNEWSEPALVHRALNLCESALDMVAEFTSFHDETSNCEEVEQAEAAVRECCLPPEDDER